MPIARRRRMSRVRTSRRQPIEAPQDTDGDEADDERSGHASEDQGRQAPEQEQAELKFRARHVGRRHRRNTTQASDNEAGEIDGHRDEPPNEAEEEGSGGEAVASGRHRSEEAPENQTRDDPKERERPVRDVRDCPSDGETSWRRGPDESG